MKQCLLLAAMTLLASACAHMGDTSYAYTVGGLVKNRASFEFHCAEDKVTVSKIGGSLGAAHSAVETYGATGCGQSAIYRCEDKSSWWQAAAYDCERSQK